MQQHPKLTNNYPYGVPMSYVLDPVAREKMRHFLRGIATAVRQAQETGAEVTTDGIGSFMAAYREIYGRKKAQASGSRLGHKMQHLSRCAIEARRIRFPRKSAAKILAGGWRYVTFDIQPEVFTMTFYHEPPCEHPQDGESKYYFVTPYKTSGQTVPQGITVGGPTLSQRFLDAGYRLRQSFLVELTGNVAVCRKQDMIKDSDFGG